MTIPTGMICRAWITIDGDRIYAKDYGKRAFCFFPSKKKQKDASASQTMEIKKANPIKK